MSRLNSALYHTSALQKYSSPHLYNPLTSKKASKQNINMSSKPTDPVPAYEELFEQRPQNTRTGVCQLKVLPRPLSSVASNLPLEHSNLRVVD